MNKREKLLKILEEEQLDNGSFGRFHTMNSKEKKKIPTTEFAAWLMHENGIDRSSEACSKMCVYMEDLLCNLSKWPDALEKNVYFSYAVPLFIASKLALFSSDNAEYKSIRDKWILLLAEVFESGSYFAEYTNKASKKIIGVEIDGSYIGLQSLNALALFAFNTDKIPDDIQRAYLHWLHMYSGKINYTNVEPQNLVYNDKSKKVISLLLKFKGFCSEFPNLAYLAEPPETL